MYIAVCRVCGSIFQIGQARITCSCGNLSVEHDSPKIEVWVKDEGTISIFHLPTLLLLAKGISLVSADRVPINSNYCTIH